MQSTTIFGRKRLLLRDVDWQDYRHFLRMFDGRRDVRLTYDRGSLEIVTLTHEHESYAEFLGRLAVTLTEELNLPVKAGGSNTLRLRPKQRGIEPDNCFWITNEPLMRGKKKLDLRKDPPPDLAVETGITHSSLDRMGVYAALRVPELWRFDGRAMSFHVLREDGTYQQMPCSRLFPFLKPEDLLRFLELRSTLDENAVIREFRAWVRQQMK